MADAKPKNPVPWVAGRHRGLARAIAVREAERGGKDWSRMGESERRKALHDWSRVLDEFVTHEVLVAFMAEYMEAEGGGTPLVAWKPDTEH